MLHIKLKGMECRVPCKHIFWPQTYHLFLGWSQKVETFFLKVVMLHIKLKGRKCNQQVSKHFELTHTPDLWGRVQRSDTNIFY